MKEKINVTIENIDGSFIKVTDVDTGYSINYWGVWSNRYEFLDDFLKGRKESGFVGGIKNVYSK